VVRESLVLPKPPIRYNSGMRSFRTATPASAAMAHSWLASSQTAAGDGVPARVDQRI
jgi:hypothetical protein